MCSLKELAQEYLQNAARMEVRIQQLESQAARTVSLEVRRKLRRRINTLHVMVSESRQTAFHLEHYYDKPEEVAVYVKPKPRRGRPRKKFSRYGYGAATPALVMHGRNADKQTVSGLRSALSRGHAAERNRGRVRSVALRRQQSYHRQRFSVEILILDFDVHLYFLPN